MSFDVRPMVAEDRETAFRIYADSYGGGPQDVASLAEVSLDNRWVAEAEGRVVGLLRELPFGQWFGGRSVPSSGVAAVGVALDMRSRGVGRNLMTGFLRNLHARGTPLSMLYMSTLAAYRPVGYEIAGCRYRYELPLEHLPREQSAEIEPWSEDDLPEVDALLNRIGAAGAGMMSRPRWWWDQRVFGVEDNDYLYRYRVREGDRTTGYIIYTTKHESRPDLPVLWFPEDEATSVVTRDLFAETPEAARTLLAFSAAQRALGKNIYWSGPSNDAFISFVPEHLPQLQSYYQWMLRLVDVPGALTARGYRTDLAATVELNVEDTTIPENTGAYRVSIEGGLAEVERIRSAAAQITIGGMAALYSGWRSPYDLARTGHLHDADLDALSSIFSGPVPWMNEFF